LYVAVISEAVGFAPGKIELNLKIANGFGKDFQTRVLCFRARGLLDADQHPGDGGRLVRVGLQQAQHPPHDADRIHPGDQFHFVEKKFVGKILLLGRKFHAWV
jgi:hypothetical protein